jgi:hypothetical protein
MVQTFLTGICVQLSMKWTVVLWIIAEAHLTLDAYALFT